MPNTILLPPRQFAAVFTLAALLLSGASLVGQETPPTTPAPPSFQPGDISIGEPIPLPFAAPKVAGADAAAPVTAVPPNPAPPKTMPLGTIPVENPVTVPGTPAAPLGKGWLGLAIAESATPGRWTVDEVAATGPAALAGIRAGDEVRAINGLPLQNTDEVSEALTAIAPGQAVRLAIARDEQISDLVIVATDRPLVNTARTRQSSPQPAAAVAQPLPPAAGASAQPAFAKAPPAFAAAPAVAAPAAVPASPAAEVPRFSTPRAAAAAITAPTAAVPPGLPPPAIASVPASTAGRTALGVRTVPIDAGLQARFNLPAATGAYVIGVVQDLPASKAGVPPGSVIVSLDERPVRSPDELTRLVIAGPVGKPVTLQYVLPGGEAHRADVVLQALERALEEALVGPPTPEPTMVPALESGPTAATARRPVIMTDRAALQAEVRDLRARLEQLERRLEAVAR